MIVTYEILNKILHKPSTTLIATPLLYIVLSLGYYLYIFNNPPTTQTIFENAKVCRVATYLGIKYREDLEPFAYRSLAYHYREKLLNDYPKSLKDEEKEVVWKEYLRNYQSQKSLK